MAFDDSSATDPGSGATRSADLPRQTESGGTPSPGSEKTSTSITPSYGVASLHQAETVNYRGSARDSLATGGQEPRVTTRRNRSVTSAEATLARQEHVADTLRLRQAAQIGLPLWLAFIPLDVSAALNLAPDAVGFVVAVRLASALMVVPAVLRLRRPPLPSRSVLRACDYAVFTTASLAVAVISIPLGGLTGVYPTGICAVMAGRGVFVKQPWREAVVPVLLMAMTYPVVCLAAAILDPQVAAEFADPHQRTGASFAFSNILAIGLLSIIAAHGFWVVRRQALDHNVIGPYRLENELGSGGMGDVWRARKPNSRRSVALKLLRPGPNVEESIHRFEGEISALARLRHSGVIRVLDYGVGENGVWYYAMPLIEGRDLDEVIAEHGYLSEDEALTVMRRVVSALASAHAAGIVHRDVKPANIRLPGGRLEEAQLLDFGIARLGDASVTSPGAILGTPGYLAPEALFGNDVDERADVYGAAATLYHALAGRPPVGTDSEGGTLLRTRDEIPQMVGHWRGEPIAPCLEDLLARALSKDPRDRPRDCQVLLQELDEVILLQQGP